MNKSIFVIILIFCTLSTISAQDIKTVFLSMPENMILGLDTAAREKLLSNPEDTTEISVLRSSFGEVERLDISSDFIYLQTSEPGTTQIKLLPLINDSKIICVVKTVCGKACDSQIQFYTTSWIPIPLGDLFPAKSKDWFIKPDTDRSSQDFQNAYIALDMNPVTITLSANNTSLEAEYDIENYLNSDDYSKIEPYLIEEPKKFVWDKHSFK